MDLISLMERASQEEEEAELSGVTATGDKYNLTAKAVYSQKKGDPFDVLNIQPHRMLKKTDRVLTTRQTNMLRKSGIEVDNSTITSKLSSTTS